MEGADSKPEPVAMSPNTAQPDRVRRHDRPPGGGAAFALLGVPVACWGLRRAGLPWDVVRLCASALCVGQALCHPYARQGSWFSTRRADRSNGSAENIALSAFVGFLLIDGWVLGTKNLSMLGHHAFTAGVYGFATLTGRALHMGRFILVNEAVSGLNALRRLGWLPAAFQGRAGYDGTQAVLYLALRLPLHATAGLVTVRQGYGEFRVLAPLLACLDVMFGGQHLARLGRLLLR